MPNHKDDFDSRISDLVSSYEASVQDGNHPFLEMQEYHELLDYYEAHEKWEQATIVLDSALEQHPFSSDLYVRQAQVLMDSGSVRDALKALDQAETMGGVELDISLLRAEALNAIDDYKGAVQVLDDAKVGAPEAALSEIFLCEAYLHEYRERYDAMFTALKEAIKADPENYLALDRMWLCVELSENFVESIHFHKAFLEDNPYAHLAWYNLGHAYASIGRHRLAMEAHEYAFLIKEDFEFAYRDCAESCILSENYEKGLDVLNEALQRFKPDADIVTKIGQCYELSGDLAKAKFFYGQALELDPLSSEVYFRLGECHRLEERWNKAIESYEKALSLDGKKEEYTAGLAEAHYQLGAVDKANKLFKRAIEQAPDQVKYWIQYASFLLETNRFEKALKILEEAKIYSGGSEIKTAEVACLFISGKRQEALHKLNMLMSNAQNDYEKLFDLVPDLRSDQDVIDVIASFHRK